MYYLGMYIRYKRTYRYNTYMYLGAREGRYGYIQGYIRYIIPTFSDMRTSRYFVPTYLPAERA